MTPPELAKFVISALRESEVEPLTRLAREIWLQHYPGIITVRQLEYMLGQRYSPQVILEQLRDGSAWWDKLEVAGTLAGFSCVEPDGKSLKLDKLYVHQRFRRHGYGRALIEQAERRALQEGCDRIYLQVNRGNHDSIAMYRRVGFGIEKTLKVDIGGGFVMDDYVMAKSVRGQG
jgi:diamine N-acetyltransferase